MAARRNAEERWRELLKAQESSGESVREFARSRGLSVTTVYWWRSELRRRDRRKGNARRIELAPVTLLGASAPAGPSRGPSIEVVLSGSRRVIVPSDFDAAVLMRLVTTLEQQC